jgi:hypothetical protein
MKYIKLFESFNTTGIKSGDNVYAVLVSATSGPDYGFAGFVFFRASNLEEAKENFGAQMLGKNWKEMLHDKEIATRDYSDFNDFINDFLRDNFYQGWLLSGGVYSIFPFKPFMKLKAPSNDENIINLYNERWEDNEEDMIAGELEALDEMSAMVGDYEALNLFLSWKFDWDPNGPVSLDQALKEIPLDYQIPLAKYNRNL